MFYVVTLLFVFSPAGQAAVLAPPPDWKSALAQGDSLRNSGNYREAVAAYRHAVQMMEQCRPDPFDFASGLNSLAVTYEYMGRTGDADQYFQKAIEMIEQAVGPNNVSRAQILVNQATCYSHRNQFTKAEKTAREAISIYLDLAPPRSPALANARSVLASMLLWRGAIEEADALTDQALDVLKMNPAQNDGSYGMTLNNRGAVRWAQGRAEEAGDFFRQSVSNLEQQVGAASPALIHPLTNLAFLLSSSGRFSQAVDHLSRALYIMENSIGIDNELYGRLLLSYASSLKKVGRKAEAKRLQGQAAAILRDVAKSTGTGMTVDVSALRAK